MKPDALVIDTDITLLPLSQPVHSMAHSNVPATCAVQMANVFGFDVEAGHGGGCRRLSDTDPPSQEA